MKRRTLVRVAALGALMLAPLAALGLASDTRHDSKRPAVETFRNDRVTPARVGRSLVSTFTGTTSSVVGGVTKAPVLTVKRSDSALPSHGKSMVVTVRRAGSNADSSVAGIDGDMARPAKK